MKGRNTVFIATSLDGYIADINGGIDWLHEVPNPDNHDMGYKTFTSQIDGIVMGRTTFETVCSFDIEWPYQKKVFVLSNTLTKVPEKISRESRVGKWKFTKYFNRNSIKKGFL